MFEENDKFKGLSDVESHKLYDDEVFQKVANQVADKVPTAPKPKAEPKSAQKAEPIREEEPEVMTERAEDAPRELSETEQEASRYGWNPDGEKSAEEWLRARPLYQEIKDSHKKIKQQDLTIADLAATLRELKSRADKEEIDRIRALRAQAIKQGDVEQVDKLDSQLEKYRSPPPQTQPSNSEIPLPPEEEIIRANFKSKHALAISGMEDREVGEFLVKRSKELEAAKLSTKRHFELLDQLVEEHFPHYAAKLRPRDEPSTQQVSAKVSADEGKVRVNNNNKKLSFDSLSKEEKEVAMYLERKGHMKRDDYLKLKLSK